MHEFGKRLLDAGAWIFGIGLAALLFLLLAAHGWEKDRSSRSLEAENMQMRAEISSKAGRGADWLAVERARKLARMSASERYGTWQIVSGIAAGFGAICMVVGWAAAGSNRSAGSKKPVQPAGAGSETEPG